MLRDERELVDRCRSVTGVDLDLEGIRKHRTIRDRLLARLECLPFPDETFDVVTANMVMEHVEYPDMVLRELCRTLRPGGRLILHTPNLRNWKLRLMSICPGAVKRALARFFEGRSERDVFPAHYLCNTSSSIRRHSREQGLVVEEIRLINSSATTSILFPLAIVELALIRLHQRPSMMDLRSNIIATLRRPPADRARC